MFQDFFKFPLGTEVELTLSRNKIFDNLVLTGKVHHYFRKPGWQTVLQHKEVKHYPVSLVEVELEHGKVTVDVDCILTKPTQELIDEIDRQAKDAEYAEKAKAEKPMETAHFKQRSTTRTRVSAIPLTTSLGAKIREAELDTPVIAWLYVASKNSKVFHGTDSTMAKRISDGNLVKFKDKVEAEASGRTYAGK